MWSDVASARQEPDEDLKGKVGSKKDLKHDEEDLGPIMPRVMQTAWEASAQAADSGLADSVLRACSRLSGELF